MRDDNQAFTSAVETYKKQLANAKGKTVFLLFQKDNKRAFYSIAPLSRALHELKADLCAAGYGEDTEGLEALRDVWDCYEKLDNGEMDASTEALKAFIAETEKRLPDFKNRFKRPDLAIEATEDGFTAEDTTLPFATDWVKEHRTQELAETAKILWRDVYNIRPDEKVSIGFELLPLEENLGLPFQDYLDSYQITWAMASTCPGKPSLGATSSRDSMTKPMERTSDLRATLLGCELCKDVDEQPFVAFKGLSEELNLRRLTPIDASFAIHGKGYPGKHLFGDAIGYPSLNKKTRWKSPGQMVYKLDFYPQTKLDDRDPQARVAFTETLPIDIFIETNLLDWDDVRARNQKVKDVLDKCDVVYVKGKPGDRYTTDLEVGLVKPDGARRWVRRSDTDVREKINKEYLERTGIRAGCMGNIPGGEAFVTPEYIKGRFVGDVVIALDQSYALSADDPFVVDCKGDHYDIPSAPRDILEKFNARKKEAWDLLMEAEKNNSLPKEIIQLKKDNFERMGEFAINTNPRAKLCDYLIVNEKIARMMHIALGSGYEEDRSTDYHIDIVFDAPRQKLDVYGTDKTGKEHWILKDGEFIA